MTTFRIVEASIAELTAALSCGAVTSVDLVAAYLNRIGYYDRQGIRLNAVPVLNPAAFDEAQSSDRRRADGETRGPLDGIPYTAKDSYKVEGLTVACGSPAFEQLLATEDAFTIAQLRAAGAICLGRTNMPPMAGGGMQRGVYGRAESPYNPDFLTSAYGSGSSNGSGTATSASFAAFGLGEETWSSGRAPASNNALIAYTPSRGVISMRGNWPLFVTMDVVVPHTRCVDDLLAVLDVIVADDDDPRGDFWRVQAAVDIPKASAVRPTDYRSLRAPDALRGMRIGVPRMYLNADVDSDVVDPIITRDSIISLWEDARRDLEALGASVVDVDFPVVSHYEKDRPGMRNMVDRGLVHPGFVDVEMWPLVVWAWNDFLSNNADPTLSEFGAVDGPKIFPLPPGSLPDRYVDDPPMAELVEFCNRSGTIELESLPHLSHDLRGLERMRREVFEDWLDAEGLDLVAFPANADVAPHDSDFGPVSNDVAWRNGVKYSNGNLAIRHLGIPTVTLPMGLMSDTAMPVGLTFAGRAYDDNRLLATGYAFEAAGSRRVPPPRTPPLPGEEFDFTPAVDSPPTSHAAADARLHVEATMSAQDATGHVLADIRAVVDTEVAIAEVTIWVNGRTLPARRQDQEWTARLRMPSRMHAYLHSHWRAPYGSLVVAVAKNVHGTTVAGAFTGFGGLL